MIPDILTDLVAATLFLRLRHIVTMPSSNPCLQLQSQLVGLAAQCRCVTCDHVLPAVYGQSFGPVQHDIPHDGRNIGFQRDALRKYLSIFRNLCKPAPSTYPTTGYPETVRDVFSQAVPIVVEPMQRVCSRAPLGATSTQLSTERARFVCR